MLAMTEEEARGIMKAHGWIYKERSPKKVAKYVYAVRKKRHSRQQRDLYICPLSRLDQFTEEELIAKLTKESPENL